MKKLAAIAIIATAVASATAFGQGVSSKVAAQASLADIPTPDAPVLMIGDSMMRILGGVLEKSFAKADVTPAVAFSSLGSGLVRPSIFDWSQKIDELIKEHGPKTVIVTLGTNDRQPLESLEGETIVYGKSEWKVGYAQRIGGIMDQLIAGGVTRVIWFLLPDMKEPITQEHAKLVNEVVRAEAAVESRKDYVTLYDLAPVLSRRPGKYTQYLMAANGAALCVRDPDGVHLTREGAKIIAETVIATYWNK